MLLAQLHGLVAAGNSIVAVEHNVRVIAVSDYVMEIGPGAGDEGGQIVAFGTPLEIANGGVAHTAPFLAAHFGSATLPVQTAGERGRT